MSEKDDLMKIPREFEHKIEVGVKVLLNAVESKEPIILTAKPGLRIEHAEHRRLFSTSKTEIWLVWPDNPSALALLLAEPHVLTVNIDQLDDVKLHGAHNSCEKKRDSLLDGSREDSGEKQTS